MLQFLFHDSIEEVTGSCGFDYFEFTTDGWLSVSPRAVGGNYFSDGHTSNAKKTSCQRGADSGADSDAPLEDIFFLEWGLVIFLFGNSSFFSFLCNSFTKVKKFQNLTHAPPPKLGGTAHP